MKIDRRLSNGLAWAGALLVVGIPAADYLSAAFAGPSNASLAVVDAAAEPVVQTAAVDPKPTAAAPKPSAPVPQTRPEITTASTGTAVDAFVQSGKPLPSYITGGESTAKPAAVAKPATTAWQATTPSPTTPAAPATQPATAATPSPVTLASTPPATEQVAALPPTREAPIPMPLSMRPRPVTVPLATNQPALIVDEAALPSAPVIQPQDQIITSDDLQDWESGPLSDFLARRGQQSSATYNVQQAPPPEPVYNEGGIWLDQVPSGDRAIRRLPSNDDEVYYLPF
ncbi:hypothetical protein VW35_05950 [Devosia soli]|uniref:Uncharacterized protein n=1 Tax=Devosia soli TaxID=361041 RepID=A0A0F5LCR6_9HYPH|nr:hypothetical protein [Devosia soli]KKB79999.1 hypothetical protein VW35_05950 [Devosia soli]